MPMNHPTHLLAESRPRRRRTGSPWAWLLVFGLFMLLHMPASAQAQGAGPRPLLTGEYVWVEMSAGESLSFVTSIPAPGQYTFAPDRDAGDPAHFTLTVIDPQGAVAFAGDFGDLDLTLEAGSHTLSFTAKEDDVLAFFLLGHVGRLSGREDAPGQLYPGSIYGESAPEGPLYGALSLAGTPYPQEVLLFVRAEPEGAHILVEADGDNIPSSSLDSADDNMLRFWMGSGQARLRVDPADAQSFTLIVMLSGPPEALDLNGSAQTTLEPNTTRVLRQVTVDDYLPALTVDLQWDDPDVDLSLRVVDDFDNPDQAAVADTLESATGRVERATLEHVLPGVYYVVVDNLGQVDAPLDLTFVTQATPAGDIPVLVSGQPLQQTMEANSEALFRFDVKQAGAVITVDLAAADEEGTDFDLNVTRQPGREMASSRSSGASESVAFVAPVAGLYFVEVTSDQAGDFSLTMTENPPAPLIQANQVTRGEVAAQGVAFYRLPIEEADRLFSMVLVGDGNADLDLKMELVDPKGRLVHNLRSASERPFEIVSLTAPTQGVYSVMVISYDAASSFALLPRLENPFTFFVATLSIVNRGDATLCSLFATPSGALVGAQVNRLDPDAPLEPGAIMELNLDAGRYDLQALDCDGNLVSESRDVLLQGAMTWPVP